MKRVFTFILLLNSCILAFGQITKQPKDTTLCKGGDATFKVNVTYSSPSFHWQKWNGTTWDTLNRNNIALYAGVITNSLSISNVSDTLNNSMFRCKIDSAKTSVKSSNSVKLFVNVAPSISLNPTNSTQCEGTNTTFSVGASGAGLTYQWQVNSGSS